MIWYFILASHSPFHRPGLAMPIGKFDWQNTAKSPVVVTDNLNLHLKSQLKLYVTLACVNGLQRKSNWHFQIITICHEKEEIYWYDLSKPILIGWKNNTLIALIGRIRCDQFELTSNRKLGKYTACRAQNRDEFNYSPIATSAV